MTDEITPIAEYMATEMNTNAGGKAARRMRRLNEHSADACIAEYNKLSFWQKLFNFGFNPALCLDIEISNGQAGLVQWGLKVRQNGEWDHKPLIAVRFHPRNPSGPQHYHRYGAVAYYYDVWSNIHYGYVGRAAGFSDDVLLDGAGLEQIGSDLLRGKLSQCQGALEDGLRACDGTSDRAAIKIGMRLYGGGAVTAQKLVNAIVSSNEITTVPSSD